MNWEDALAQWKNRGCSILRPVTQEAIDAAEAKVGLVPPELRSFYSACNGLNYEWFRILPVEEPSELKKTWDGIVKANTDSLTSSSEEEFLKRFLIFATLDAGQWAVVDRNDFSIWFEEKNEMHRTDLSLAQFIEVCLREVDEL